MPVHDKVTDHARNKGEQTAINIEGQTLSWQRLWLRALAIFSAIGQSLLTDAKSSAASSIRTAVNRRVIAVALGNRLNFAPAWLAATADENICAVIDPLLPPEQLQEVLCRLAPCLLVVTRLQTTLIRLAQEHNIPLLLIEDVEDLTPGHEQDAAASAFVQNVDARTPFLINFTSGTTSTPKAFMRSRRSWRESFKHGQAIFALSSASSTLFPGPLFHGIGLYCLNEALDAGNTFYCMAKWQPSQALALIEQHQIPRLVLVPTMLTAFSREEVTVFSSLTHLLSAGAKLEINHYRSARRLFPNARIQEYYGASELGFIAVSTLNDENVAEQLASVGSPFPHVSWSIRDKNGSLLPVGHPGFIFIQSEQVCSGYLWGDDGNAFKTEPYGSTVQDIGYINPTGTLQVIGRSGDMVISGGNNIYLSEVESVLKALPGMVEAVVLAIDDEYRGKKIVACFESDSLTASQLPALCLAHLAKYKVPVQFCQTASWPLTASGKIKRRALEKMFIHHETP